MDVTGMLLRVGAARPHVLVVTMPGSTAVRLAVEEQLRRRGWPAAMTPADADVLCVAGDVTSEFTEVLGETWRAMPTPRTRARATSPAQVATALVTAQAELADRERQRTTAEPHGAQQAHGRVEADETDQHGHDMGGADMGGADMGGMDDMQMPAGLPMADRGEDRDGLKLDQLHVPLGPILPDWPAGLVLHLVLQGDVIQQVDVDTLDAGASAGSFWTEPWRRAAAGEPVTTAEAARRRVAADLDSLGRFLAVAGWEDAATTARRVRDDTLSGASPSGLRTALHRLTRRVVRSRTLSWSTRGLGVLTPDDAVAAGVSGPALRAAGDVTDRCHRWCGELIDTAAVLDDGSPLDPTALEPPRGRLDGADAPSAGLLAALPRLLGGAELAAARLIVASLDPDLDELTRVRVSHGH